MITNTNLHKIASDIYTFQPEEIDIEPPQTEDKLPAEWKEKLGRHLFTSFAYYVIEDVHLCGVAQIGIKDNDVLLENGFYGRVDLYDRNRDFFKHAVQHLETEPTNIEWGLSLGGCWSHNFFHWNLDSIPRLEVLPYVEQKYGVKPTVITPVNPYPFMEEGWNFFKPEGYKRRMNSLHYHVKNLVVPLSRRVDGLPYPSSVKYLESLAPVDELEGTSDKLYISRKYAETRHVENEEDELFDNLLERGFSLITPEKMSFARQVAMFQKAKYIIAPHGAGLVNQVWATDAKVIELVTPKYSSACTWLIGEAKQHKYGMVMCEHTGYENMLVDWNKVERIMDKL